MYRIVDHPIDVPRVIAAVEGEGIGGIATFSGSVRVSNAGKSVVAVEYQAYPTMAERVMREIGEEIRRGHGPVKVAMVHRIGRLRVGEVSVVIAVGSPHRHDSLAGVAYAIERLKQVVPIWKKEFYADGSAWLEPAPWPPEAAPPGG